MTVFFNRILIYMVLIGCLMTPVQGTVLVPLTHEELTHASDLVVVARVVSIVPGPPGFSFIALDVQETLKGTSSRSVTIKLLGGQMDDRPDTKRVDGVPLFTTDQRAVFFLRSRPEESGSFYNVTGWAQGKLDLDGDDSFRDGQNLQTLRTDVSRWRRQPKPSALPRHPVPSVSPAASTSTPSSFRSFPKRRSAPKGKAVHTDRAKPSETPTLTSDETLKRRLHPPRDAR